MHTHACVIQSVESSAYVTNPKHHSHQQMQFVESENRDGIRFSWNCVQTSNVEGKRLGVPSGFLYTPLKPIVGLGLVRYKPVLCLSPNCGAILNPYCRIDFRAKIWVCPFCEERSRFPPNYAEISRTNRPAEILPQYTTLEYV
uniref:Protein transport protein SEC23 n=1 Tax=Lygus hesperus TaxID=30085 RepID=A0A0A9WG37_LYGHE